MADPVGISVAFDDGPLVADPTWTQLDLEPNLIARYSISRGRRDEFDRTGTGTAQIQANDINGIFDPTNASGPYYNTLDGKQAALALRDPCAGSWSPIFRGLIDDYEVEVDPSQKVSFVTIPLVDGLDYLAQFELRSGTDGNTEFDSPPAPASTAGNVWYPATADYGTASTVDGRINHVLDDVTWPAIGSGLREVFTGNVHLQATVYSPGTPALTVIDEAADAEFPGIANRYIRKDGAFVFHGRLARFDPTNPDYDITTWKVGDGSVTSGDPTYAQLRGLSFSRPRKYIYNSALFSPQGIADADLAGQLVEDSGSQTSYGLRSISADNLRIADSVLTGNNANDECKLYGDYYVTVFNTPTTRVTRIVFRSMDPADPRAPAVWALMCGIDISDRIKLKVTNPGGGGWLDEFFFVEGITYDVQPLQPDYQNVTLTLDVSPASDYDFPWT